MPMLNLLVNDTLVYHRAKAFNVGKARSPATAAFTKNGMNVSSSRSAFRIRPWDFARSAATLVMSISRRNTRGPYAASKRPCARQYAAASAHGLHFVAAEVDFLARHRGLQRHVRLSAGNSRGRGSLPVEEAPAVTLRPKLRMAGGTAAGAPPAAITGSMSCLLMRPPAPVPGDGGKIDAMFRGHPTTSGEL